MPITVESLMQMSAEKAAREVSLESIEFLFRPNNAFELLLRCDFDGTVKLLDNAIGSTAVNACDIVIA